MRKVLVMMLMMITSTIYAQKVLPFDDHLEDALIEYLVHADHFISREFMEALKQIRCEITDDANEYCEPIAMFDLQSNRNIDLKDMTQDFGVFLLECPMIADSWGHVLIKYHNKVIIIEDDLTPADDWTMDWDYDVLIKHTEFLNSFFRDHTDIPKSYYPIFLKNIISAFEWNHYE